MNWTALLLTVYCNPVLVSDPLGVIIRITFFVNIGSRMTFVKDFFVVVPSDDLMEIAQTLFI